MRTRPLLFLPAVALTLALTGCGGSSAASYGTGERSISVDAGETFTLEVPASSAMGENWYLADPKPDTTVLDYDGRRNDHEAGEDGTQYFDFTASHKGTTTVKLVHCPNGFCHSAAEATATPSSSAAPNAAPVPTSTGTPQTRIEYYEYKITVR
ncbi:protease inhibitor I42 family protein [Streptomyces sp. NPDC050145]|uniref:protease inhibitor I42 family protein n=1 Tax=Streptomyces sp. NPDC050145 TaxID=3365602 RepID=UPI0037887955